MYKLKAKTIGMEIELNQIELNPKYDVFDCRSETKAKENMWEVNMVKESIVAGMTIDKPIVVSINKAREFYPEVFKGYNGGKKFVPLDGRVRLMAYGKAKFPKVSCRLVSHDCNSIAELLEDSLKSNVSGIRYLKPKEKAEAVKQCIVAYVKEKVCHSQVDISKRFGISQPTVSRIFNDLKITGSLTADATLNRKSSGRPKGSKDSEKRVVSQGNVDTEKEKTIENNQKSIPVYSFFKGNVLRISEDRKTALRVFDHIKTLMSFQWKAEDLATALINTEGLDCQGIEKQLGELSNRLDIALTIVAETRKEIKKQPVAV